ncbi:MAG: hypothetical protein PHD32_02855 [Eubacteriales bacterium]|nr:hypothetical protein [Eubacteriales bacterium]
MKRWGTLLLAAAAALVLPGCARRPAQAVVYTNLILPDMEALLEGCGTAAQIKVFPSAYALEKALTQGDTPDVIVQSGLENTHYLTQGEYIAPHGLTLSGFSPGSAGSDWFALGGAPYVWLYDSAKVPALRSYFEVGGYAGQGVAMVDPLAQMYYHAGAMAFMGEDVFTSLWQELGQGELVLCESEERAAAQVCEGKCAIALTTYALAQAAVQQNPGLTYCIPDQKNGMAGAMTSSYVCMLGAGGKSPEQGNAVLQWLARADSEAWLVGEGLCPFALRDGADVPAVLPLQASPDAVETAKTRCGEILLEAMES